MSLNSVCRIFQIRFISQHCVSTCIVSEVCLLLYYSCCMNKTIKKIAFLQPSLLWRTSVLWRPKIRFFHCYWLSYKSGFHYCISLFLLQKIETGEKKTNLCATNSCVLIQSASRQVCCAMEFSTVLMTGTLMKPIGVTVRVSIRSFWCSFQHSSSELCVSKFVPK